MMNNTGRVLGFNFYEMWQMPHADESFALIMVKLNKEVPEMMDDTYVESIIYQLRQLGSGEVFVDYARKEVDSVRSQISKQALRELSAENLVANHVYRGGCVETGAPCMYSNGPCSCLPVWAVERAGRRIHPKTACQAAFQRGRSTCGRRNSPRAHPRPAGIGTGWLCPKRASLRAGCVQTEAGCKGWSCPNSISRSS